MYFKRVTNIKEKCIGKLRYESCIYFTIIIAEKC